MTYEIIKTVHIIAIICWMAGIFYLPRLYVYHVEEARLYNAEKLFQKMEKKLFHIIMMPAFLLSYITGLFLAYIGDYWLNKWFIGKMIFVFLLTIYHYVLRFFKKKLINCTRPYSGTFFRILNEVPTIFLIFIIAFVVLKPFQ